MKFATHVKNNLEKRHQNNLEASQETTYLPRPGGLDEGEGCWLGEPSRHADVGAGEGPHRRRGHGERLRLHLLISS